MGKEDSFVFYTKYGDALRDLTPAQQGAILMACISYVKTGEVPDIKSPTAAILFKLIRQDIDADKKKYAERCEKNRANAYERIRSQANATERNRSHAMAADKDKDKDKDIYKGIYTRAHAKTKFSNFDERDPAETVALITKIGGAS